MRRDVQQCSAFKMRPVDAGQMLKIAEKMRPVVVEDGEQVARCGDSCDVVWFVASGSLSCKVNDIEVQKLGAGQCIGEMSFISVSTLVSGGKSLEEARATALRSADVFACEHTELLELSFDDAWKVSKKVPNLFYTLKEVATVKAGNCERKLQWAAQDLCANSSVNSRVHVDTEALQHSSDEAAAREEERVGDLRENERVTAVRVLGNVHSPVVQALCEEALVHFGVTHASVNLVDAREVRQQALAGRPGPASVPRDRSLCWQVLRDKEQRGDTYGVLVVTDIAQNEAYVGKAATVGFYAGVEVRYSNGGRLEQAVGTLCLYDEKPRETFSANECKQLREYGEKVTAMLASPLPSLLGDNGGDHHLHSIDERVAVLTVSAEFAPSLASMRGQYAGGGGVD